MTMNEKYFPKRARFIITNKLIDSIMNKLFDKLFIEDWRIEVNENNRNLQSD